MIVAVWLIYALLTFLSPDNPATTRYGLSFTQLQVLRVTFLIPNLFIWLTAGYAVIRLRRYELLVKGSPESKSLNQISEGLLLLLLALIVAPFVSMVSAYDPGDPGTQKLVTIFRNYIQIIFYLSAFWQLWRGSKNLIATINTSERLNSPIRKYLVWLIAILGAAFISSIYYNEFRTQSNDPTIRSTYYLPDWLILLTIVAPYVLIWLWGSLAIVNFRDYSKSVKGVVYKKAFANTSFGLIAIIGLSISLQFLSQLAGFFGRTSLSIILGIIYLIFLVMAIGYFFIARGVKKLTAIEET